VNFILGEAEGCFLPLYGDNATVETLQSASEIAAAKKREEDAQLAADIRACGITPEAVRKVDTSVEGIDLLSSGIENATDSIVLDGAQKDLKEAEFSGDPGRIAEARLRLAEVQAREAASGRDRKCKSALIEAHNRAMKGDWSLVPTSAAPVSTTVFLRLRQQLLPWWMLLGLKQSQSRSQQSRQNPETWPRLPARHPCRLSLVRPSATWFFAAAGRSCEAITDHVWVNPAHVSLMCDRKLRVAFIQGPKGWRLARPGE